MQGKQGREKFISNVHSGSKVEVSISSENLLAHVLVHCRHILHRYNTIKHCLIYITAVLDTKMYALAASALLETTYDVVLNHHCDQCLPGPTSVDVKF